MIEARRLPEHRRASRVHDHRTERILDGTSNTMPGPVLGVAENRSDIEGLKNRKPKRYGSFFQIDIRTWHEVCNLGLNAAVAYLVLARGSGPDNSTTSWSVQAIEKYTGISRGRAGKAILDLCQSGLVNKTRSGTRPRYDLTKAEDYFSDLVSLDELTGLERDVLLLVRDGLPLISDYRPARDALMQRNILHQDGQGALIIKHDALADPQWIWLPNELVSGAAEETPPIELVRQTQDSMTLRLFIDLYAAHALTEDGGIKRTVTYQRYDKRQLGESRQFKLFGFSLAGDVVRRGPLTLPHICEVSDEEHEAGVSPAEDFVQRFKALADLGLIEWIPYLYESDGAEAEPIHPIGLFATNSPEDRVGILARSAGTGLLPESLRAGADAGGSFCIPVLGHMTKVEVIGIARLRYRPKTKMTAAWRQAYMDTCNRYIQFYKQFF